MWQEKRQKCKGYSASGVHAKDAGESLPPSSEARAPRCPQPPQDHSHQLNPKCVLGVGPVFAEPAPLGASQTRSPTEVTQGVRMRLSPKTKKIKRPEKPTPSKYPLCVNKTWKY